MPKRKRRRTNRERVETFPEKRGFVMSKYNADLVFRESDDDEDREPEVKGVQPALPVEAAWYVAPEEVDPWQQ